MAFSNYNIDFKKLIVDLLDVDRRTSDRIAWIFSLLAAVESVYQEYLNYSNTKQSSLSYAPGYKLQVEALLQSTFNSAGIYITNNRQLASPNFLYDRGDLQNLGLYNRNDNNNSYLNERGEYDLSHNNFTVHVPASVVFDQNYMRAVINSYKRVGLTFNIVTY